MISNAFNVLFLVDNLFLGERRLAHAILLHLITAGSGTSPPGGDVRIHGEFWRVPGPLSEVAVSTREVAADRAIKAW
jgi:hypothetical protein